MNCEICQSLLSDFVDGGLSAPDQALLGRHLEECLECAEVRRDLSSIVDFCHVHRGEYDAPPNERALWLRIQNVVESESGGGAQKAVAARAGFAGFLHRSWELTLPQLAASVAVIVLMVSLATVFGVRRLQGVPSPTANRGPVEATAANTSTLPDRYRQQQQVIDYWNQRVELNQVRWSPQMRDTFTRNMNVIDSAVSNSLLGLSRNPHDEVSEEVLNSALNDKLELLKEFADL